MNIQIEWDPKEEVIEISEDNSTGEVYHISGTWPAIIDDICGCLHDYLEGVDHSE